MVISLSDTVFTSKTLLVQSSFSIQLYPLATGNRVVNPAKTEMTAFEDHIASTFRITMHSTVTLYLGVRRGARWPSGLGRWLVQATGLSLPGSNPTAENFASEIPFTPLCQCLSEETLKAVGPFYLVSMPWEVKDPTSPHWNV